MTQKQLKNYFTSKAIFLQHNQQENIERKMKQCRFEK